MDLLAHLPWRTDCLCVILLFLWLLVPSDILNISACHCLMDAWACKPMLRTTEADSASCGYLPQPPSSLSLTIVFYGFKPEGVAYYQPTLRAACSCLSSGLDPQISEHICSLLLIDSQARDLLNVDGLLM